MLSRQESLPVQFLVSSQSLRITTNPFEPSTTMSFTNDAITELTSMHDLFSGLDTTTGFGTLERPLRDPTVTTAQKSGTTASEATLPDDLDGPATKVAISFGTILSRPITGVRYDRDGDKIHLTGATIASGLTAPIGRYIADVGSKVRGLERTGTLITSRSTSKERTEIKVHVMGSILWEIHFEPLDKLCTVPWDGVKPER
jgi:hypothetical protein